MTVNGDIEKKALIKHAARELFFRFGFNKTAMSDIAQQSGMAKPTLYYYYPSKETIFDEIVVEEATGFINKVEKKMPRDLQADEKLAFFFRTMYQDLKEYARKMADMPKYLCEHSPHGHPIVEKLNLLFMEKLIPLLREGRMQGRFDFEDEPTMAATLVYMSEFLNFDWMQHYPETMRDRVVETMISVILNGLKRSRNVE
ncbi:MAG: TetR/AcrR family transcriptional regulator [Calditrichaeota bacterium]|nr:TetR/AcrR family transcriptional regulator [Calditrichota bacterium]MCB0304362.1 TetR/AcrR family transcriptional regulator [Calditrichota bacterium]